MKLFGGKSGHSAPKSNYDRQPEAFEQPAAERPARASKQTAPKKAVYQESEEDRRLREQVMGADDFDEDVDRDNDGEYEYEDGYEDDNDGCYGDEPRHRKRWPFVVGTIVLLLICAFVVFQVWVKAPAMLAQRPNLPASEQTGDAQSEQDVTEPEPQSEDAGTGRKDYCYTFLIAGRDKVSNSTDTIMAGMLDTKNHKLNIVSFPRDMLINSTHSIKKINYVYPAAVNAGKDATQELLDAAGNVLGYHVDSYAIFDIQAFVDVIDAMGGVEYEVPIDMYYDDPTQDYHVAINKGYQWLSGENAMKVFRFRVGNNGTSYPGGDIQRIDTQHDFMMAVAKQMLSVGNIPNLSKVIDVCVKSVDTNLSANNMAYYAQEFLKLSPEDITIITIPANTNGAINGMSYVFPHIMEWVEDLNLYFDPFYEEITTENIDMITRSRAGQFIGTQGYIAGGEGSFGSYGGGTVVGNESNTDTNDPAEGLY